MKEIGTNKQAFKIRKASIYDAKQIFDIRTRAILAKCSGHYDEQVLIHWTQGEMSKEFLDDVAVSFYVTELNGDIIGSGQLRAAQDEGDLGLVDAIFVDPLHMGSGAAKAMIVYLEQQAKTAGFQRLKLDATLNAAPFYQRCGFIGTELSHYHSPRGLVLSCVPMEKSLS
ncbi:GNAT family N-acetyltransferase [Shewanella sp. SR44-3]|uniref:GNAT family N-acetyltransferase n=1 Tax=unclassified Shewanella TaxID=196818 RepID=UPI0015F7C4DE|nr:GNAT family N-acetyltransferase [Shewanella sp. SR44-3]MBB1270457.1 GNAT family N-acetyltransferase [Shewanella sp. SR44-3]